REMLLNFQSIVERMSTDCKGKAWVACTAQQSLDELAGNISDLDVKDEFGKILGRFDTRISLESTDAAYITQRRVLEKNSRGIDVLQKMFKEKRDAIEMQFKTNHDLFRGFEGEDDFYLSYPFVPYQFRLISHVFDAFQNLNYVIREVKDNERSVLGITHYTARENATRELGYFMPFDAFYNHQFSSNMQNRGRKAIEPAMSLSFVKRDPFAQRVVKALFMVSNLSDPIRQTFPANIDNLALLMMDRLDQNKLDLQHKIKDVLDHLLDESVIREEKGSYFFFKEDEIEVTNEINNTVVNSEDRLQEFFDLISPMFNVNQKVRMQNTDFSVGYNVDDKQFIRGNHAGITFVVFETRDADQIRLANPDNRLLACINEWLGKEEALRKDFTRYLKTVKYLKSHSDGAMGQRMETLNNFRTRNNRLKDKIKANFQKHLPVTRYVSGQSIIDASDISGSTPAERHRNAVEKHLSRIFRHMKLADSYAATNQELRDKLKGPQQKSFDNTLSQAEEMVENEILNLGNEATVADLVNKFSQPPFGWKDVAVIDILTCLNFKRKRSLEFKNNSLSPLEFADKAFSNAERGSCVVRSLSGPGQEEINQAIKDFREIFNENIREDTDFEKVIAAMKQKMDSFKGNFASLENDYYGKFPPGIHMHTVNDKLRNIVEIRNPEIFFSTLKKEVPELKLCYETAKTMEGWLDRSAKEYKQSMDFIRHNASNFHSLENGCEEKARILTDFLEDTVPWENFRPVLKAIEEFKTVLKERMNSLRQETLNKYKAIYDELEKKCEAENLAEDPAYYAPRKEILARIEKQESITELENTLYKADKFYDDAWQKLAEASNRKKAEEGKKVKPTVSFKPVNGRKLELKSEEDVEIFIEEEKKALLKLISENKIVVIN
ncbi:MAG: BREX system P-loop protein BrxC, partial [Bacteroidales bacterium]|nr:BREX system P-loop protein BrxC [Bacteroidales bacterium]